MTIEKIHTPDPIDIYVGGRVRLRRTLLGMSQDKLGKAIGLTFQQIQKYERGANRMGASRLYKIAQILDVPVSFFFDDLDQAGSVIDQTNGQLSSRETLELVRYYYRIEDVAIRRKVYSLIKAIGTGYVPHTAALAAE